MISVTPFNTTDKQILTTVRLDGLLIDDRLVDETDNDVFSEQGSRLSTSTCKILAVSFKGFLLVGDISPEFKQLMYFKNFFRGPNFTPIFSSSMSVKDRKSEPSTS